MNDNYTSLAQIYEFLYEEWIDEFKGSRAEDRAFLKYAVDSDAEYFAWINGDQTSRGKARS